MIPKLREKIFTLDNAISFEKLALDLFLYQSANNPVYKKFISSIGCRPDYVKKLKDIPFLPIEFFKSHKILCSGHKHIKKFYSSRTTGNIPSINYVTDLNLYEESILKSFMLFYGHPEKYCIMALMPSPKENPDSSLIHMVKFLIDKSKHPQSGFYLNNEEKLADLIEKTKGKKQKTIIIGLSYALLDFIDLFRINSENVIIIETGGMKGQRKEMVKTELHLELSKGFGITNIHSEYSMSELFSQSWSKGSGFFYSPPWKKIIIRDPYDPFYYPGINKSGGINIIDLANIYSCAFIETRDLGKVYKNGSFEVLGRFDNSDIRGCNLLI
ncbi:acyl transferase [Bacteroidota bacterium]